MLTNKKLVRVSKFLLNNNDEKKSNMVARNQKVLVCNRMDKSLSYFKVTKCNP